MMRVGSLGRKRLEWRKQLEINFRNKRSICTCNGTSLLRFNLQRGKKASAVSTPDTEGTFSESREPQRTDDRIFHQCILVPIDFSEPTAKTVTYAVSLAVCFSCPVTLLHVINLQDYPIYQYALEYTVPDRYISQYEYAESEARNALKPFENLFSSRGLQVGIEIRVGSPFEEILTAAEHCSADLIVIGSHGRTGIGRLLLGNTAERVIERARCPVLVVTGE